MNRIKKIALGLFILICIILMVSFILIPMPFAAKYTGQMIPTNDGKKLVTLVHLPDGNGPFPTLIIRSPYELPHTPLAGMFPPDLSNVRDEDLGKLGWKEITDAGYALVIQHTRGRVGSEGKALDLTDRTDGLELIKWVKKQNWSNGKVGTCGDSIEAILAMLTNAENPEGLDASFVQIGTPNLINEVLLGPGGALKLEIFFPWAAEQILTADANHFKDMDYGPIDRRIARVQMGLKVQEILSDLENPQNVPAWKHLPLKDYPHFSAALSGWNQMLSAKPNSQVSNYFDASLSTIPTYYVAAWYDVFSPSQLNAFERGEKDSLNQRLLVLNGTHFSAEDPKVWPMKPLLPWFDYHLKGKKSALLDLPRVIFPIANGQDEWYGATTWPPNSANIEKWHLSKTGQLSKTVTSSFSAGIRTYQYNPENPVPTIGGRNLMISHGPLDQQTVRQAQRKDVLSYDSQPLNSPIVAVGHVYGNLSVSSDCPDTDFTIKLLDISPEGTATLVTEGIIRARFKEGLSQESFMKPDEIYPLTLDLGHIAWRFESGHSLGVDVSSSNFPQWDRNLNTNQSLFSSTEKRIANNIIHHGQVNGSFIELPIISDVNALEHLSDFKTNQK